MCKLVLAQYKLRWSNTYYTLNNVYISKPFIVNSSLFLVKNVYLTEIKNINFKSSIITSGNIFDFENDFNVYIFNITFNELYI